MNFLDDIDKMCDYLNLTRDEFLKSYSYVTEKEYDNTDELFHDDIVGSLCSLWRDSENLLSKENLGISYEWNVNSENLKTSITSYAENHLDGCVYEEFLDLIPYV